MRWRGRIALALALCALQSASVFAAAATIDRSAPMNYMLHCQGCHKEDGSGQPGIVPSLRGSVAKFLAVPEGRDYLVQVPGTAQSMLSDAEVAEVLNWAVGTFDPEHVPSDFIPYDEHEVARLRSAPISQTAAERAQILARREADANQAVAAPAPVAFSICAACHPVTADAQHALGPNLHGVVGRGAGTVSGYGFSEPMRRSGIVWSGTSLDEFLRDPATRIPGNTMAFAGVAKLRDRQAIIEYLASLESPRRRAGFRANK
jgi:cytochrome c2